MKKIFSITISLILIFESFSTIHADNTRWNIPYHINQAEIYKAELLKTAKGKSYKKTADNIIKTYKYDRQSMENLEVNIRSFYTLNKEKLENKENIELFNFLGYLNEIVTIICQNFFQQEVKEKTKPFVLAYEKTGNDSKIIFHSIPNIGDTIAKMEVGWKDGGGGAEAIFYRIDSTADWQFFTFAQEPIPCERYNTEELQKAFFHQICNYNFETKERNTVGNYLNLKK